MNQARRLGQHFSSTSTRFSHIFSSHLTRAARTAELVREAQDGPAVVQTPLITEQDFGSNEGKPWGKRDAQENEKLDVSFMPPETREAMNSRIDRFLDDKLVPIIFATGTESSVVAIVSHGIALSVLWKRILFRLPPSSVQFSPTISAEREPAALEHLGRWDNTCYVELSLHSRRTGEPSRPPSYPPFANAEPVAADPFEADNADAITETPESEPATGPGVNVEASADLDFSSPVPGCSTDVGFGSVQMIVERINSKEHLKNLKRTGGGVGSSRFDSSQKSIESFFKRPRKS